MAIHVSAINNMGSYTLTGSTITATGMKDNDIMHFSEDFLAGAGVVNLTTDALVTQNSPAGASVLVAPGRIYVLNRNYTENQNTQTRFWRIVNDASFPVTIAANSSGNPRIDLICARVNPSATPGSDAQNSATFVVVQGTPAASPVAPSIPSDGNSYYTLAQVAVANGFSSIVNANITDSRTAVIFRNNTSASDVVTLTGTQTLTNKTLSTGTKLNANADPNFTFHGMARQALINSNFDVWQRSTSGSPTIGGVSFFADRWRAITFTITTPPTITHSRQSNVITNVPNTSYNYRITTNGAGSGYSAGSIHWLEQLIEFGTRYLAGLNRQVTVSFWARSSIVGKRLGVGLIQNYGTGGSPTADERINGTNYTLTSTWTRYTFTFTLNTLSGKTFGTNINDHLRLIFGVVWNSDWQALFGAGSAETFVGAGDIDIAQVQLCAGDVALPYQPISFESEYRSCCRYYEIIGRGMMGRWASSSAVKLIGPYKVQKRSSSPTITLLLTNPQVEETGIAARTGSGSVLLAALAGVNGVVTDINGFSGATAGAIAHALTDNIFGVDAEL